MKYCIFFVCTLVVFAEAFLGRRYETTTKSTITAAPRPKTPAIGAKYKSMSYQQLIGELDKAASKAVIRQVITGDLSKMSRQSGASSLAVRLSHVKYNHSSPEIRQWGCQPTLQWHCIKPKDGFHLTLPHCVPRYQCNRCRQIYKPEPTRCLPIEQTNIGVEVSHFQLPSTGSIKVEKETIAVSNHTRCGYKCDFDRCANGKPPTEDCTCQCRNEDKPSCKEPLVLDDEKCRCMCRRELITDDMRRACKRKNQKMNENTCQCEAYDLTPTNCPEITCGEDFHLDGQCQCVPNDYCQYTICASGIAGKVREGKCYCSDSVGAPSAILSSQPDCNYYKCDGGKKASYNHTTKRCDCPEDRNLFPCRNVDCGEGSIVTYDQNRCKCSALDPCRYTQCPSGYYKSRALHGRCRCQKRGSLIRGSLRGI